MFLLDVLLRYATITLLLFAVVKVLGSNRRDQVAWFAAALCITTSFTLFGTAPEMLRLPEPLHTFVRFTDCGSVLFAWLFGLALFCDSFKLGPLHWAMIAANMILIGAQRLGEFGVVLPFADIYPPAFQTLALCMMAHLTVILIRGRDDDLIAARRRFRFWFLGSIVGISMIMIGAEYVYGHRSNVLSIWRSVLVLPVILWALISLTHFQRDKLTFEPAAPKPPRPGNEPAIDPRDAGLLARLTEKMETGHIYKQPGLTIRTLAEALDTPEHRLRALINQGLGHRNFSAYLNAYRIEAVKTAMADPKNSRTPILTLAMDVGFNSLAPFNRAFRALTGATPSAFRQTLTPHADQL